MADTSTIACILFLLGSLVIKLRWSTYLSLAVPEPLLRAEETFHRKWQKERFIRVIRQDLRDLEMFEIFLK